MSLEENKDELTVETEAKSESSDSKKAAEVAVEVEEKIAETEKTEKAVTDAGSVTENEAEEVIAEERSAVPETTEVSDAIADEVETEAEEKVEVLPSDRRGRGKRGQRKPREREEEKPQSEWIERVVQIRRVTKVVKGGKKLSFRAIVIVGNKKGQVGVGCAKASEVIIAIQKAIADGRKNLITVPIFKTTIPHPITGRSGAGSVMLRPASQGTGIIAGGAVRLVLELAGIENILSKSLGSKSPLNAANATLDALKSLTPFSEVAKKRGLTMAELLN